MEAEGRVVGRTLQQPVRASKNGGDDGSDEGADDLAENGVPWLGQRGLYGVEFKNCGGSLLIFVSLLLDVCFCFEDINGGR